MRRRTTELAALVRLRPRRTAAGWACLSAGFLLLPAASDALLMQIKTRRERWSNALYEDWVLMHLRASGTSFRFDFESPF